MGTGTKPKNWETLYIIVVTEWHNFFFQPYFFVMNFVSIIPFLHRIL